MHGDKLTMLPIAAAAAFVALFALWVIVPRFFIRRKENENAAVAPIMHEDASAQPAPSPAD